jgi:hypothetical protein
MKYLAYKKIKDYLYFINKIEPNGHITLISADDVKDVSFIGTKWNTSREAKKDLFGKRFKIIESQKAQTQLNNKISFK